GGRGGRGVPPAGVVPQRERPVGCLLGDTGRVKLPTLMTLTPSIPTDLPLYWPNSHSGIGSVPQVHNGESERSGGDRLTADDRPSGRARTDQCGQPAGMRAALTPRRPASLVHPYRHLR